ncbi:hypothetical protein C900_00498 [Fulvivirga imtechensis AK7]|uniref:Uncharacterized protein n=1 Tax=Fulvivirga imtechensis AK7 TaxID=1237149 RepID=L8JVC5_9BACT|nr:hypothetical protein C900_00498 [Fulvivirga imtechensis AK7]
MIGISGVNLYEFLFSGTDLFSAVKNKKSNDGTIIYKRPSLL